MNAQQLRIIITRNIKLINVLKKYNGNPQVIQSLEEDVIQAYILLLEKRANKLKKS